MKMRPNLLSLAALAVVLSACQITGVGPGPFPGAVLREATESNETPLYSGSLRDDETIVIAVRVPSHLTTINGRPAALYLEATGNVDVTVYNQAGTAVAYSASDSFFTPPADATATGKQLSAQAVATTYNCMGPCIIRTAQATTYFVRLENTTGSRVDYEFLGYTRGFDDLNEPGNNTRDGRVDFTSSEAGAIETLGDEDWFRVNRSGSLTLGVQSGTPLNIKADLFRPGETTKLLTLSAGQSHPVSANYIIRVYEKDGWAGPSSASTYYLNIP